MPSKHRDEFVLVAVVGIEARGSHFHDVLLHCQVGIQKNTQVANDSNWLNHLGTDRQCTVSRLASLAL